MCAASDIGIRVKDEESDAVRQYRGPVFFPLDLSYRVTAAWLPSDGKQTVDVPNVLGDVTPTPIAGTAVFKVNGQELRLTDLGGDATEELFFVFSDPTSKTNTYPGGRFLKAGPVANGTVISTSIAPTTLRARSRPTQLAPWRQRKTASPWQSQQVNNTTTKLATTKFLANDQRRPTTDH